MDRHHSAVVDNEMTFSRKTLSDHNEQITSVRDQPVNVKERPAAVKNNVIVFSSAEGSEYYDILNESPVRNISINLFWLWKYANSRMFKAFFVRDHVDGQVLHVRGKKVQINYIHGEKIKVSNLRKNYECNRDYIISEGIAKLIDFFPDYLRGGGRFSMIYFSSDTEIAIPGRKVEEDEKQQFVRDFITMLPDLMLEFQNGVFEIPHYFLSRGKIGDYLTYVADTFSSLDQLSRKSSCYSNEVNSERLYSKNRVSIFLNEKLTSTDVILLRDRYRRFAIDAFRTDDKYVLVIGGRIKKKTDRMLHILNSVDSNILRYGYGDYYHTNMWLWWSLFRNILVITKNGIKVHSNRNTRKALRDALNSPVLPPGWYEEVFGRTGLCCSGIKSYMTKTYLSQEEKKELSKEITHLNILQLLQAEAVFFQPRRLRSNIIGSMV